MAPRYDYDRVSYVDPHPGKEDHEVLWESKCPRCGGTGEFREYDHIEGGICFECRGEMDYRFQFTVAMARKDAKRAVNHQNKVRLNAAKAKKFTADAAAVRSEWATLTKESEILVDGWGNEYVWEENPKFNRFVFQLWNQMQGYGTIAPKPLSEKQIQAGADAIARAANWEQAKAEREAAKAKVTPVVEGKQVISGEVYAAKSVEGQYGISYKFGIRQVNGQTYWGTIPKKLVEAEALLNPEWAATLKGTNVVLRGTVSPAKDDHSHGFFARPTLISSDLIPTDS